MDRRVGVAVATMALVAAACSSGAAPTPEPEGPSGTCALPPRTYDDLAACNGSSEEIELEIADSFQGKTVARIAIPSKDPQTILAAMGAYTAEWSVGANSFTLFAYGSASDYEQGSGYNRVRIYWNDGGPITVDICTEFEDLEGIDWCADEEHLTVANR